MAGDAMMDFDMGLPGGGGFPGELPGGRNAPKKERERKPEKSAREIMLEMSRRRLLTTLAAVQIGLAGSDGEGGILAHAKNEPHVADIGALSYSVSELVAACDVNDFEIETRDLLADLQDRTTALEEIIDRVQTPAGDREKEPVAAADELDGPESEFTIEEEFDFESADVSE